MIECRKMDVFRQSDVSLTAYVAPNTGADDGRPLRLGHPHPIVGLLFRARVPGFHAII